MTLGRTREPIEREEEKVSICAIFFFFFEQVSLAFGDNAFNTH